MIFLMLFGKKLHGTCLVAKAVGVVSHKIIAGLSMRCFGSCVPERHGGICLQIMVDGAIPIVALFAGVTVVRGKSFLKF